jgi:predicted tellurium resistance membrane protein TerC
MVDFADADVVKAYPLIQLAAAVLVVIVGVAMTLRATSDNKKDGHIAPQGHDPYGFVVTGNSILMQLSIIAEAVRRMAVKLDDMHSEQVKTNSRLGEMKDSHAVEMDRLRDAVERLEPDRR